MATNDSNATDQKALVENIKGQWRLLWNERFNDKLKAEGISAQNYELLKVDRGTVIQATRDFKPLNLKEVLEENKIQTPERFIQPNPQVGGWNKFVKTKITNQPKTRRQASDYTPKKTASMQPKKGGRGWLHKQ